MNITREEKKQEALARLQVLTETFGLNPNIIKYFEEDRLYYSYTTCMGLIGSIDTIEYDPRYARIAEWLEQRLDCLVYHAIEYGGMLALLFVSDCRSDWESERLQGRTICAYVQNFDEEDWSEVGFITVASMGGALIRVG